MRIDILTQAEKKVDQVERILRLAAVGLRINVEINRTNNFAAFSHLAINPSQTPIVIIEGKLEFAGKIPELEAVKKRLIEIRSQRGESI